MTNDLTTRAMAAYFRTAEQEGATIVDQPANTSGVVEHNGRSYVVLENIREPLWLRACE
jgi:hypothetical protein